MRILKGTEATHIRFNWLLIALFGALIITSCSGDDNTDNPDDTNVVVPSNETTELLSFSFLKEMNMSLESDMDLKIDELNVSGRLPYEAEIERLIATFEHGGYEASINGVNQTSNATFNDFTSVLPYTIKTKEGKSETYNVDVTYFTGLPIISIKTDGNVGIDSKEEYVEGTVSIKGYRYATSLPQTTMKIRGRGNSTWWIHPKKPYQMKFSEKESVLDMPEDKKWIFLAEYSDKSLIRNRMAFEMGYISNLTWTPDCFFAEVFVNDVYDGIYNITQKVEASSNRVALGDTGFLLEIDQPDRLDWDDVYFNTSDFLINIKEPEISFESNEYDYVKNHLNAFESTLHGDGFKDLENGYHKYIDVDSFVDWYLISEIVKNQDSRSFSSIFLHFIPGEKIRMGPLWDFDLAFGNVNYSECTNPDGFWVKHHKWYSRLFEDPEFVEIVKTRFAYFRDNQQFILDKIDELAEQLKWSQEENDKRWDLFGNYVWPNPVYYDSHEEEINHLKNWYNQRMNWLDSAFQEL